MVALESTPRNKILRVLEKFKYDQGVGPGAAQVVQEEAVVDYKNLMSIRRDVRKRMAKEITKNYPHLNPRLWSTIPESLQRTYMLQLEQDAKEEGYPIHLCQDMFAAEILLKSGGYNASGAKKVTRRKRSR